ncbi:MAG: glycerol-3-phosphate 1-O-acyltransferase PlsY [Coriobacteriia bacterium]|nr:glycerol-3-phosphate 1-O-acyltransferase PlsY [Coriobacteriia bacterium]
MSAAYGTRLILVAIEAFLLGSIPTSYLLGKYVYGVDPREFGSGATGATNTARAMGLTAGIVTALVDIFKGWLAIMLARQLIVPSEQFGLGGSQWAIGLAIIAVIAGHAFSPWLSFRGGKGVAVAGGAALALWPPLIFIELAILVGVALISGYVGLGSIVAACMLPVLIAFFEPTRYLPLIVSGAVAGLFILWLHRENIVRLRAGNENKLTLGKSKRL